MPPGAGYRRLENQLYRVEIHKGGQPGTATFKWSRDNGSVVTSWLDKIDNDLTVSTIDRDEALGFSSGQWVELTDDTHELNGIPGKLVKLDTVDGQILTIDPTTAIGPVERAGFPENPRIRRWDCDGEVTVEIPLEDGVEVRFEVEAGTYKTGDYWLIPARTAKGDIEWPCDDAMNPLPQMPHGIKHHYCRLALLQLEVVEDSEPVEVNWIDPSDCRRIFPAVTELTSLFYVSGDGQEAMPGEVLPGELIVGVANGQWPVGGATVRFTVIKGSGNLKSDDLSGTSIEPATKDNGLAACTWELDDINDNQQVEAILLDDAGHSIHIPIRFNANLSKASGVAYDPQQCSYLRNLDVKTVQDAIDELCNYTEPAIQIKNVLTGQAGDPLANDTVVFVEELAQGLQVICDQEVDTETIEGKPTCFVMLDMPFPFNFQDQEIWGDEVIGYRPLILAANIQAGGVVINWKPTDATHSWLLEKLFGMMIKLKRGTRLLAHLTLKGNFIWAEKDSSLYLDGEAFGVQAGKTETNLKLPIGNGRRGGDFEMWFWLMESNGIRYVEYDIFDKPNIPEDLIVENGLCDDGKKNCDTQGEGESKISGGRFYAMVGSQVALNGNSDALVDLLVNEGVDDDGHVINVGESFSFPGGITLTLREIDIEGQKAMFSLSKDGEEISNKVVNAGELYTHIENEIMGEKEVPVFVTFVKEVFAGMNTNMVKITSTWLISMD